MKYRTNFQLHQNKNTRASGVFILVKCGIGFEPRNHLIAGSTMSCCVARCAWHTAYECPAVPRHQRGRGNQPLPLWSVFVSWRYGFFTNAQFQYLVFVSQYIRRPTCDGIAERIFLCTAGRFYQVLIYCNSAKGCVFAIIRDTIFRIWPN